MYQHGSKYFAQKLPPWTPGWGQNAAFSEHGHVAYHIKGNDECKIVRKRILLDQGGMHLKIFFFYFLC